MHTEDNRGNSQLHPVQSHVYTGHWDWGSSSLKSSVQRKLGAGGGGLAKEILRRTRWEERKMWPDPSCPLELEAVLKFIEAFCVKEHSQRNTNFHDSEYSKDDRIAQKKRQASPQSKKVF